MRIKTIFIGLLALGLGLAPLQTATPAHAGGGFSVTYSPKGKDADIVRKGLQLYAMSRELSNQARIDQHGTGNTAAVTQTGSGNWGGVFQRGHGHSATLSQNGDNNTLGVFQLGRGTHSSTKQSGNGQVALVFQGGW